MFYWDPTYILVIIGLLISLGASAMVNSAMRKYHQVHNSKGITGAECARRILDNEGLYQVQVEDLGSNGGDHFDPQSNVVRLSHQNYSGRSITAMGVAAHECGHAMQHNEEYGPLRFRSARVPAANLGSRISWPLILIGMIFGGLGSPLVQIGILMFTLAVLFQLVTLPVEFNASNRAVKLLDSQGILASDEVSGTRKVLSAAALTYVAAAASSILQLLRLVILFGGRDRRD